MAGERREARQDGRRGPFEPPEPEPHRPASATLVVNPDDGGGRVGRDIPAIEALLRKEGLDHRIVVVRGPGESTRATRDALDGGERFVVAVGGDGTVNDVLNGFLEDDGPIHPDAVLGVLSAGSGCDVTRTFGLPEELALAVPRLMTGNVFTIDVGRATTSWGDGERTRYFLNMAQVGLGGLAVHRAARLPRILGRGRFLLGYWLALATYRRRRMRLRGDRRELEEQVSNLLVANLQYFRQGILISPRSWPEDGYLDLQVYTGPRSDTFTLLPKMFVGEHLPHPRILELRSREVGVEAEPQARVEVDGKPWGRTPATFRNLPRVLRFKV